MTTIAFDHQSVAWDMQETSGGRRSVCGVDKVVVIKNVLYGVAGDADCCEAVPLWHAAGAKLKDKPDGDWEMVCVSLDASGQPVCRVHTNEQPRGWTTTLPAAVGSGGKYALAAMTDGKDALAALLLADKLDVFTGPPFKTLSYGAVLKPARPAKATTRGRKRRR